MFKKIVFIRCGPQGQAKLNHNALYISCEQLLHTSQL